MQVFESLLLRARILLFYVASSYWMTHKNGLNRTYINMMCAGVPWRVVAWNIKNIKKNKNLSGPYTNFVTVYLCCVCLVRNGSRRGCDNGANTHHADNLVKYVFFMVYMDMPLWGCAILRSHTWEGVLDLEFKKIYISVYIVLKRYAVMRKKICTHFDAIIRN